MKPAKAAKISFCCANSTAGPLGCDPYRTNQHSEVMLAAMLGRVLQSFTKVSFELDNRTAILNLNTTIITAARFITMDVTELC